MRRWIGLVFLSLTLVSAKAQYNPLDTFRIYLKKEPTNYFSFDGRNSFVRDEPAQIDGMRFGLSYGGKIRMLVGMYRLRHTITREYVYAQGTPAQETRFQENKFMYLSFTCDYVLFNRGRWKLALPVQSGFGFGSRLERNDAGEVRFYKNFKFIPFEVSLNASFRILPWFTAGAGIGYRYALFSNTISADFSAPIYTYGLGLDVEWFWDKYFKERVNKRMGW